MDNPKSLFNTNTKVCENCKSPLHESAGDFLYAKNFIFPLAFCRNRAIIVRQSFPRPLDGVADIEGCDGHIH